jgi:hypothetical protein
MAVRLLVLRADRNILPRNVFWYSFLLEAEFHVRLWNIPHVYSCGLAIKRFQYHKIPAVSSSISSRPFTEIESFQTHCRVNKSGSAFDIFLRRLYDEQFFKKKNNAVF